MIVELFGTLCTISISIVSIIVTYYILKSIIHSFRRDIREQGLNKGLVRQVGEIYNSVDKSVSIGRLHRPPTSRI